MFGAGELSIGGTPVFIVLFCFGITFMGLGAVNLGLGAVLFAFGGILLGG